MSSVVRSQALMEPLESSVTNLVPEFPNTINAISKIQSDKIGPEEQAVMTKTYLTDRSVTCNDGSPSG